MRLTAKLAIPVVGTILLTGCGMKGKWELESVDPTAMRTEFDLKALTLEEDGTYYAQLQDVGSMTSTGTYKYEDGMLVLKANDGPTFSYEAEPIEGGQKLELKKELSGEVVIAQFTRKQW